MPNVGAQMVVQQTGTLQDALVFTDKFSTIQCQRIDKGRVKLDPGSGCAKTVTAAVVKVFLVVQLAVPQWIVRWIGIVMCHPYDNIISSCIESLGMSNQLLASLRLLTEATNVGPHPVLNFGHGSFYFGLRQEVVLKDYSSGHEP